MRSGLNDLSVMVVEDEDAIRSLMRTMLNSLGITRVYEAAATRCRCSMDGSARSIS